MRFSFALILSLILSFFMKAQNASDNDTKVRGAVYCDSSAIKAWAVKCKIIRGYMNIENRTAGFASTGSEIACTGKADNISASLGDSGVAVISFNEPFSDISGNDFAVFENSFDGSFLELAFVEVSSDSIRWVRFPSVSGTQTITQVGTFETLDPSKISNLAGKYRVFYGTPFDLADIKDSAGIDLSSIKFIRIIDVVGIISGKHSSFDSKGSKINDPWPTEFPQSGFDLDAVALLRSVPAGISSFPAGYNKIYPNPAKDRINIEFADEDQRSINIRDLSGRIVINRSSKVPLTQIDISRLYPGTYLLEVNGGTATRAVKFIKE